MSISKKWIVLGILYGAVVFLLSPSFKSMVENPGFWNVKEQLLYLTGSLAMACMVISMIISIRNEKVNKVMGGLDKAYVVHKWVGIWAFAFSIMHWLVKEGPKFLSHVMTLPAKIKSTGPSPYTEFEESLFDFGNEMVEIAFYVFLAVVVVSLIKKIPYNIFRYIHKVIPVLFLVIAYHGASIQIKGQWFGSIGSVLLFIMLVAGCIPAVICLFQQIGKKRKAKTIVEKVGYYKDVKVVDLSLTAVEGNFDYHAGQYVFLKFKFCSEPHPFSIASYDETKREIRFLIKELGDFTKKIARSVQKGEEVIVEGPYGGFNFKSTSPRQIWVAGGIGVAPFVSRLEYLVATRDRSKEIDFFYSARGDNPLKVKLEELCKKAGINFFYCDTAKEGRLCMDKIREKSKNIEEASIWYCGPSSFCRTLKQEVKEDGKMTLHYDDFDMR